MKKYLILTALIFTLTIIFLACSEERDHASPFDPEYWDSDIPSLTDLTLENTTIDTIKLTWINNAQLPERFSYRIDKKIGDGNWIENYKILPSNQTFYKDKAEINQVIKYRAYIIYDKNTSDNKESSIDNTFPAPTNLTVTQTDVHTFTLNWADNSTGEDGFKIERKIDDGSFSEIATVSANTLTFVDETVTKKGYGSVYYQVRAYKDTTYYSTYASANSSVLFPAPTNLTVTQASITSAHITWTDNSIGEEKFEIERKLSTESTYMEVAEVTGSDTVTKIWADPNLIIDLTYDYRVRAIKGINSSVYDTVVGYLNEFKAPSNLIVTFENFTSATISWNDDCIGEDKFEIERKLTTESIFIKIGEVPGSDTSTKNYTDSTIEPNLTYNYRVRTVSGTDYSDYATTSFANPFPAPTNLTITQVNPLELSLAWTDNSIGEEKFEIERKLSTEPTYVKVVEVTGSDTATKYWTDATVILDLTYDYRVRAVYGSNNTAYITKTFVNTFSAPSNLLASVASETAIALTWTDNSAYEQGFKIDRKIGSAGTWVTDYNTTSANVLTWSDTGLESGTKYYYRIRAYFSTYFSNYTNEATITTIDLTRFVTIPTGSFEMGSNTHSSEQPIHTVNITRPFYLGKYEVTQKEWSDIMGSNPANTYGVGDNFPTYFVNWYETLVYCNKRSIAEGLMPCYTIGSSTNPDDWGSIPTSLDPTWDAVICNFQEKGFRLPTEAEWEYAARYNDDRIYPWGNGEPFPGTCNFDHNEGGTTVVGYFLSGNSSLGLCDMAGNVYEWCWDWYDSYTADIQTDPTGVISGTQRVVRGGGWPSSAWYIRCAHHTGLVPYQSYSDGASGFRIARTK